MKMKRLFSKGTVLLIWSGFALFFFTAQISIFQVTSHVERNGASFSNGGKTTAKSILEAHAIIDGRCYNFDLKCRTRLKEKKPFSLYIFITVIGFL